MVQSVRHTLALSLSDLLKPSQTHHSAYQRGTDTAYLLLYVDDIVLTASSPVFLWRIILALQQEFEGPRRTVSLSGYASSAV